ncbi:MAG: hypothetical protein OQL19_06670 [Gammaproteobacteria bacterium]|nr:hypothetical protein [Gammaproteobacteria bacterium]
MKTSKILNIVTLSLIISMASFTSYAIESSDIEKLCQEYAVDEQITQDEIPDYIETCIQRSSEAEGESSIIVDIDETIIDTDNMENNNAQ